MRSNPSGGFIRLIVIIIVLVVILAYFKIDPQGLAESDFVQKVWSIIKAVGEKIWDIVVFVWENYLQEPALWVWQNWVLDWLWPLVSDWLD